MRSSMLLVLALGACKSAGPAAAPDCGSLAADNAVRTEMVRLESRRISASR